MLGPRLGSVRFTVVGISFAVVELPDVCAAHVEIVFGNLDDYEHSLRAGLEAGV